MTFLTELFVFLSAALIIVPILNRLGLSSVIGYLVAGIAIAHSGIDFLTDAETVLHFAEIGVVLLLFIIGLELQPRRLWVMRRAVFGLGLAQVSGVTAVLTLALWITFTLSLTVAAILGFALALSSTAFVLQLLAEKKQLNHAHGRAAFGVLLLQDVAVIPAIVLLSAAGASDGEGGFNLISLVGVIALIVAARFLLKPLLKVIATTGVHELFIAASLAIVSGAALVMYQAGLSMGLGAFIAGMLVADSEYRHQLETDVMPFKGLLLGLFFIAVGMSADLNLLITEPMLVLGLTFALVALKILTLWPIALVYGLDKFHAIKTATVLSQGGEFAFVLLTAAVSAALLPLHYMEMAVLVVTLSMATTPFLMMLIDRISSTQSAEREFDAMDGDDHPIIIAGFGRFGQIFGRVLTMQHRPFTAMDINPVQVDFVREFGNEVYYGDATRLDLLRTAGIADASALIITVDDIEASVHIAETVRELYPTLCIFARARNRQHEIKLRDLGVKFVVRETLHSSLALAKDLMSTLGIDPENVDRFKQHDEKTLKQQAAVVHDDKAFRQTTMDAAEELRNLFSDDLVAEASVTNKASVTDKASVTNKTSATDQAVETKE